MLTSILFTRIVVGFSWTVSTFFFGLVLFRSGYSALPSPNFSRFSLLWVPSLSKQNVVCNRSSQRNTWKTFFNYDKSYFKFSHSPGHPVVVYINVGSLLFKLMNVSLRLHNWNCFNLLGRKCCNKNKVQRFN